MARMKLGTNTGYLDVKGVEIRVGDEIIDTRTGCRGVVNMYGQCVKDDGSGTIKLQDASWAIDKPYESSVRVMSSEPLTSTVNELKEKLSKAEENNQALVRENARLRSILDKKGENSEEIEKLKEENADLQSRLNIAVSKIEDMQQNSTKELEEELKTARRELEMMNKNLEDDTFIASLLSDRGWEGELTMTKKLKV